MTRRVFIDPWRKNIRPRDYTQYQDSHQQYKVDFSASATERGTSVSSVTWSSEGTQQMQIANESLSSGVASADIYSEWSGFGLVKVVATYADAAQEVIYLKIRVFDPEDD